VSDAIVAVASIARHYPAGRKRRVRAVDGVTLDLRRGETLALVGESGCGKSTLARLILRLEPVDGGRITFEGRDITDLDGPDLRAHRRFVQMVFQDPYTSLDPRMTAEAIVREPLDNFKIGTPVERLAEARRLLARVGLRAEMAQRYPHELSGGQQQRLGIARALALKPRVLVADEPVSALDVSIRAQVINLLMDLQAEFGLTLLFVSHDIGVVAHVSHRIAVMYLGRIVEIGDTDTLLDHPAHPYTRALLDAVPAAHPRLKRARQPLEGDLPSPSDPPPGCPFHPRCPLAIDRCRREIPALRPLASAHDAACHLAEAVVLP
jgi:oligopeptide/dipeptide ABC transporter ATP-binding protein